jgi:hypothetical protein
VRHILHLVAFDLKALRWWFAAWGALLIALVLDYVAWPTPINAPANATAVAKAWLELLGASEVGLPVLRIGLAVLIAALVVQRDSLLGTTARWMTMPISRGQMLTSKLLTGFLTIVLPPTLIAAAAMLLLGLFPGDVVNASWPVATEHATAVLIAFALAAVTATLTHFVMAVAGGFAVSLLLTTAMTIGPAAWWPDASIDVGGWHPTVILAMPLVSAFVVVIHQYLTLKTRRSVVIIACALVLQAGAIRFVVGEPAAAPTRMVDRALVDPEKISVTIGLDALVSSSGRRGASQPGQSLATISTYVKTAGQPASVMLRPVGIESEIAFPGFAPLRYLLEHHYGVLAFDSTHGDDSVHLSIKAALGESVLMRDDQTWPGLRAHRLLLTELPFDIYNRMASATGTFSANLTFMAFRYRVLAAIPVRPGQSFTLRSQHVSVVSVYRSDNPKKGRDSLRIGVRITSLQGFYSFWPSGGYYLLRNASRRQAVYLTPFDDRWGSRDIPLGATGPRLNVATYPFGPMWKPSASGQGLFDDEWMKGAELVLVGPEDLGTLTRRVRVDNFSLRTARTTWYQR